MDELAGVIQPQGFPGLPAGWVSSWETYPSADGKLQLFAATHRKANPPAGHGHRALIVCHGIGEHGGRYLHFPHYLDKSIDVVFCPDHRGHGRSEGLRGHVDSFKEYSEDFALSIRKLDERLKKQWGKSEIHVLGHSLGSLIMLKALYDHADLPVRSACASAPLLELKVKVPLAKKAGAGVLSRVWGSIQMSNTLDPLILSHDKAVAAAYSKDRLVHPKITPRMFVEMRASMKEIEAVGSRQKKVFAYPLLMLVPMEDEIVNPEAALAFFRSLKTPEAIRDKQSRRASIRDGSLVMPATRILKTYPGFYHESFNEIGKERVFEDLEAWIKQHSDANSSP